MRDVAARTTLSAHAVSVVFARSDVARMASNSRAAGMARQAALRLARNSTGVGNGCDAMNLPPRTTAVAPAAQVHAESVVPVGGGVKAVRQVTLPFPAVHRG